MEKPILFNTEMVKAILDGRKTQTRRLIRPQPEGQLSYIMGGSNPGKWDYMSASEAKAWDVEESRICKQDDGRLWTPPCHTDDLLYVRETWFYESHMEDLTAGKPDLPSGRYKHRYVYYADHPDYPVHVGVGATGWRPSIHMPKEAARIWLKVKKVKVQRLQEITNDDAKAEGVTCATDNSGMMHRHKFRVLWDSITDTQTSWEANPWVWVIEFERMEGKHDD